MLTRMAFDDVSWEQSEKIREQWIKDVSQPETLQVIGEFIVQHRRGRPTELCDRKAGAFNFSVRMKFSDGGSAIIRFPIPGTSMFPEEKVRAEVAVMKYLNLHTSIPVPFILHWGTANESPLNLGPFIIMEYIKHEQDLADALNDPSLTQKDRPRLDPNIDGDKLKYLYRQLADILLQLSQQTFSSIGSLQEVQDSTWDTSGRPLSMGMNELVRVGTLPRSKLPQHVFHTASSYYEALSLLHTDHLTSQRNDAVSDDEDCRRRFTSRWLFRKLAKESALSSPTNDTGPFILWCDDFRPANILLDANLKIVGVIDWEFSYAAPADFSFAPPWWLLLEQPEYWKQGLDDWKQTFDIRLQSFLAVLVEAEEAAVQTGRLRNDQKLSEHMRESWAHGGFWVSYAARKSFAFDSIFWKEMSHRFFGPCDNPVNGWKEKIDLLEDEAKEDMERLVRRKAEERRTRVLAWDLTGNV